MKLRNLLFLLSLCVSGHAWGANDTDVLRLREPVIVGKEEIVANAVSVGNWVRVEGTVKESAVALGGDVYVGPMGTIEGNALAVGGRVVIADGGTIVGKVTSMPFSAERIKRGIIVAMSTVVAGMGVLIGAAIVLGSIGSVALALLVLVLFPGQTMVARQFIEKKPLKTGLYGLAGLTLAFPVLIFLFITIVGIPLSFIVAAVLVAALILGTVAVGQTIGFKLANRFQWTWNGLVAGIVGLFILTAISAIPVIGLLSQATIVCLALGSVAISRFRSTI